MKDKYSDDRIDKLPQWAQQLIGQLVNDVRYYKDAACATQRVKKDTRLFVSASFREFVPINADRLLFTTQNGSELSLEFDPDGINIRCQNNSAFMSTLVTKPIVSNVIRVMSEADSVAEYRKQNEPI